MRGASILKRLVLFSTTLGSLVAVPNFWGAQAADFIVYSVYKPVDLGGNNEAPQRDYFVNMGSAQGVRVGSSLEVLRRSSTYDLTSQKLYRDVIFPIARLKVIHVEDNAAIARMDKMLPSEKTPSISPRAVLVGDLVAPSRD
jgi:hypothetical protein